MRTGRHFLYHGESVLPPCSYPRRPLEYPSRRRQLPTSDVSSSGGFVVAGRPDSPCNNAIGLGRNTMPCENRVIPALRRSGMLWCRGGEAVTSEGGGAARSLRDAFRRFDLPSANSRLETSCDGCSSFDGRSCLFARYLRAQAPTPFILLHASNTFFVARSRPERLEGKFMQAFC